MTARFSGSSARPHLVTRRRVDDEYTLSPQTVYRLVGGLAAFGVLLIAVAVFVSGNPKSTLTGHLTHRGRPVIWGSVILYAPDGTATAGVIDPDGTYTVHNAPAVAVGIAVISHDPQVQHVATQIKTLRERVSMKKWQPPPVDRKNWFPLPKRYEDPKTSGLSVILTKGKNEHNIELP
jgi:hypothetical protein